VHPRMRKTFGMNLPSDLPIVQAPMAGGPSTPALTAAVTDAGGYGILAGGYLRGDALRELIIATRSLTDGPFGVNLFVPSAAGNHEEINSYAKVIQPEAERLAVDLGDPFWEDDDYDAKLDVVESAGVHMVSFTFGCPTPEVVDRLHRADILAAVTVTSGLEAELAARSGADLLAVQGTEAGGHQGCFLDLSPNHTPLLSALAEIRETIDLPMIAAGGIMSGEDAAAALQAGAVAVAIGTALLCSPEAGTSQVYRQALLDHRYGETIVTRAFSGRFARGLANRFALEHDGQAPQAYPEIHHLTRPLRAAATKAGNPDVPNLWAGTRWQRVTADPAAEIVRRIAAGAQRPSS
jgi:nitronate monooxygenase